MSEYTLHATNEEREEMKDETEGQRMSAAFKQFQEDNSTLFEIATIGTTDTFLRNRLEVAWQAGWNSAKRDKADQP